MSEHPRPRPISFNVSVTESDWDSEMGGWRLTVLRLPGVRVDGIYVEGQRTDPGRFGVDPQQELLRWMPDPRPSRARIAVTITEELTTQKESDQQIESWRLSAERWKSLAALFTAAMAILGPGATLAFQHWKPSATAQYRTEVSSVKPVESSGESRALREPEMREARTVEPANSAESKSPSPSAPTVVHAVEHKPALGSSDMAAKSSRNEAPVPAPPGKSHNDELRRVHSVNVERCFDGTAGVGTVTVAFQKDGSAAISIAGSISRTEGDCMRRLFQEIRVEPAQATGRTIQRTIRFGNDAHQDSRGGA